MVFGFVVGFFVGFYFSPFPLLQSFLGACPQSTSHNSAVDWIGREASCGSSFM